MEMMPLNFSSTRSQMILLLKYCTGSHCKENNNNLMQNCSKLQGTSKRFSQRSWSRTGNLHGPRYDAWVQGNS
ncbi:hypothetical protein EYF80_063390 [Liparis tanakae]|uniref:Uncharacterized protein n=1 Tax=Liparis tanakae TaxID=230148 RepID=A0A4Z2ECM4_9TELE|nr:hypothetical protein EYF80_063390 [Liparis tanakae]